MSPGPGAADLEDSNMSSPLSEVDDKDTNDDEMNIHLDNEGDDKTSTLSTYDRPDARTPESDSDSALSDAQSVVNSEANDTEAETERLYDTPQHQRQRDVVVDQFNDGQIFEHTPSKLKRTVAVEEEENLADNESLSGDAASNPPTANASDAEESPSKPVTTKDTSVDEEAQFDLQDRKRKRSPAADTSESDQPSRKRTGSVGAAEAEDDRDTGPDEEEAASNQVQSTYHSPLEPHNESPEKQETPIDETEGDKVPRISKKTTRNGVKSKSNAVDEPREAVTDTSADDGTTGGGLDDEVENVDEMVDVEAEEEAEAEAAARNAEECKLHPCMPLPSSPFIDSPQVERKQAAFKDWSKIEEMFGIFRDRLVKPSGAHTSLWVEH